MSTRLHAMALVISAFALLSMAGFPAEAKKPKAPPGKRLEIRNCTSMNLRILVSNLGPDIERSFEPMGRVSFPIMPMDKPLIQIKSKQIKKWKTFYSLLLPPLEGGQAVFSYRWTGEQLEMAGSC